MGVYGGPADWWTDNTNSGRTHIATKGIVQSGLVLNLDAGVTTSYNVVNSTVWNDLSPTGNTSTLYTGTSFDANNGGIITFDGIDGYVFCNVNVSTNAATFSVWMKRNSDQSNFTGIMYSRGNNAFGGTGTQGAIVGMNFYSTTNQVGYTWGDDAATYNFDSGLVTPNATWCMCVVSLTPSNATLYLCQTSGINAATNITTHTTFPIDQLKLGIDDEGGRLYNGQIATAQLYNRALSASEVTQNFNAMRGRFNV